MILVPHHFTPQRFFFIYLEQGEKYVMKEPPQEIWNSEGKKNASKSVDNFDQ